MTEFFQDAHEQDQNRAVSLLAQDQYMREVRWMTLADRQEEAHCIERIKRGLFERKQPVPNEWRLHLAKHARTRLVESYQPVIIHLATSLAKCSTSFTMLDLVNEGSIGLMTLLDRLDAYEDIDGASLNALAFAHIRGAMLNALRDRNGIVRISERTRALVRQLEQVAYQVGETLGREPTVYDMAEAMHLSIEKVLELMDYRQRRSVESLEGLLEDGNALEHLSFVSLFEAQVQADRERASQMSAMLQEAMATALTPRQQEVVRLRYGFDEGPCKVRSHGTVASMLGVGPNAVQVCDSRARERLSSALAPVVASSEGEWSA